MLTSLNWRVMKVQAQVVDYLDVYRLAVVGVSENSVAEEQRNVANLSFIDLAHSQL